MKGLFVTFEGIDGCGKSTQIELFRNRIAQSGHDHIFIREPGGTPIGEQVRTILLDKIHSGMKPETELLLFEAARAQNVRDVILPALEEGKIVLCDRFADSSVAYQGYGRKLGVETVELLNKYATGNTSPDITFLLDLEPTFARERLSSRDRESDRLDNENIDFIERTRAGYLAIAEKEPQRVKIINASNDINEISEEIYQIFLEVERYETGLCNSQ